MKKSLRKIFSLVLSVVFCMSFNSTVFAASDSDLNAECQQFVSGNLITSLGNCIASDSEICTSGYYCEITLHLNSSVYGAYFRSGAVGNGNNYVSCDVTFPNGITHHLGNIMADGSTTPYLHITGSASAGDYVFKYYGTNSGPTGFAAFIYSDY